MTDYKETLVEDAGMTTRTTNGLMGAGYHSMEDALAAKHWELLRIPNFGRKSLNELEAWASERGGLAGSKRTMAERQLNAMLDRLAILEKDIARLRDRLK